MIQGLIRDKGCPKAHCLKRPTRAVSILCFFELFYFAPELFLLCFPYVAHLLGCYQLRMSSSLQAKVLEYWSPAPQPEGDVGKNAAAPANLKEPEVVDLEVSSDSSFGGESDVEVIGASIPPQPSMSGRRRRRHAI